MPATGTVRPVPSPRNYDHRVRDAIVATGDATLFPELDIPPSTAKTWIRRGTREVVGFKDSETELLIRVKRLERQLAIVLQVIRLLLLHKRLCGTTLTSIRIPHAKQKRDVLRAIERARRHIPLRSALRPLGLTPARYHEWQRKERSCTLDDQAPCPKSLPQRIMLSEVQEIGDMVQSTAHRHIWIRALALHAQRIGRVFAHPTTWSRLIKERGWRRPRLRLYPAKPKVGVRASQPNAYWHVDASVLRLVDGTRIYLSAIIDNFSRRILAWSVEESLNPLTTFNILQEAAEGLEGGDSANVVMDSGVENVNGTVDPLFDSDSLRRVLAQVDVTFSNSMIESWWRSLKHQWLYLHTLDSVATVRKLVEFYVEQHNTVMPHAAFNGLTPDEVYFGRDDGIVEMLVEQRAAARKERVRTNREVNCPGCQPAASTLKREAA